MSFYQILQLDPTTIKKLMKQSDDAQERTRLKMGMIVRSVLIVVFAMLFIGLLTSIFGSENSSMAVVIFCILLSVRFVDFGYCIKDSLIALAIVFTLLLISPVIAFQTNLIGTLIIHFITFLTILILTASKPEMGNGSLFSFAYIFLAGNPVYGTSLWHRGLLTLVGFVICGSVFYHKHHQKYRDSRLIDQLKKISSQQHCYQWMVRFALGISIILTIGTHLHLERFMWAGFACGALLSDHSENPALHERMMQRLIGVVEGSILFYLIYQLLPLQFHVLIGPLGGVCLGFCSEYKHKTILNSLGALLVATSIYGVQAAINLRIVETVIGLLFAIGYMKLSDRFINRINDSSDKLDKKIGI